MERFTLKFDKETPEITVAVLRVLRRIGYVNERGSFGETWTEKNKHLIGWMYIKNGVLDGWDGISSSYQLYSEKWPLIEVSKPETHTITIDGKDITISHESYLEMQKSLT